MIAFVKSRAMFGGHCADSELSIGPLVHYRGVLGRLHQWTIWPKNAGRVIYKRTEIHTHTHTCIWHERFKCSRDFIYKLMNENSTHSWALQ